MARMIETSPSEGGESSDSDYRRKRRKMAQNDRMNGGETESRSAVVAPPAKPNSFAAKMMAKMGYVEGQGLGVTGRGRLAPIETQMRPQGAGLGAVKEKTKQAKEEEKREAAFKGEVLEDSEEEERKKRRKMKEKKLTEARNSVGTPMSRSKVKYRTAVDIEAATDGLEVPNVLKSIIDATGTETKMLTSTVGLMMSKVTIVPSETEAMKIARRARRDLEAFADEWNSLAERKTYYELQEAQLLQELDEENKVLQDLEALIGAVQKLLQLDLDPSNLDAWEEITTKLEEMEETQHETVERSALMEVAIAALHPLFKTAMQDWNPLGDSFSVFSWIERLGGILQIRPESSSTSVALTNEAHHSIRQTKTTTPYETMIYTLWLPPVRSAVSHDWDVHDPTILINLIQTWRPVLPPFVLSNLLNGLVARRLTDALQAWRPYSAKKRSRRNHEPPHIWLFPWLQYLDDYHTDPRSRTGILADVKRKLKTTVSTWDLTAGIPPGLESWQSVLQNEIPPILLRHLLPRLAAHLSKNLIIDPSDQDLGPLSDVLQWSPFFASSTIAHLLVAEYFPKWHQTLYLWLTASPNYEEIRDWFQWWKEQLHLLSPGINEFLAVAAEWTRGLETISLALDLGLEAASQLPPPSDGPALALSTPKTAPSKISTPSSRIQENPITFRDIVEHWCAEQGLIMMPLREADPSSGFPLFRITASASGRGGVVVYLKGDVLWVRGSASGGEGKGFMPLGLDEGLAKRAEGR